MRRAKILLLIGVTLLLLLIIYLLKNRHNSPITPVSQTPPVATPLIQVKTLPAGRQTTCNPDLWAHVWNPWRLKILDNCVTVTGKIDHLFLAEDGDYHLTLLPDDPSFGQSLVVEIICAGPIEKAAKTAQKACAGYTNQIPLPQPGDHVAITGTHVFDTNHSWPEIHPVSHLDIVPQRATMP